MSEFPWITVLIAVPVVTAIALWVLPALHKHARVIGLTVSLIVLALAVVMATSFDVASASSYQFAELAAWIPQIGVSYALGLNGLGLVMVLLACALVPIVLAADWNAVPDDGDLATVVRRPSSRWC